MSRLKKQRPDLNALMEPRHTIEWAQKVLQSRWKAWIYASRARYLSTSLFNLDAKQFNELAQGFVKAGSCGQLPSCLPSSILSNSARFINTYEELVDTIDRQLIRAFYDYSLPFLSPFMQKIKTACQFSPTTWFPHTMALARSINIHIYDLADLSHDPYQEVFQPETDGRTTVYCGSRMHGLTPDNSRIHYTNLAHLDTIVQQIPNLDTLILDMDHFDWRWTRAYLDTPARTVHIRATMDDGRIALLKRVAEDRGEDCRIIDHRSRIDSSQLTALSSWQDITAGDCIVAGSRHAMMNIKDRLEYHYGLECAMLFHQLPQEIQFQQINAFNNPGLSPKVLLMSDEISVLPCKINAKRLLFRSVKKEGQRGKVTYYSTNKIQRMVRMVDPLQAVTVFDKAELPFVKQALISKAPYGIYNILEVLPSKQIFESFYKMLPEEMSMSSRMDAFEVLTDVGGNFAMHYWAQQKIIADWLEHYSLSFDDQWTFMNAPVDITSAKCKTTLRVFGEAVSRDSPCELDDVLGPPLALIRSEPLMTLVNQYKIMQWYHWFRSQYPHVFVSDETVLRHYQEQYQEAILESVSSNRSRLTERRRKSRQHRTMEQLAEHLLDHTSSRRAH